MSSQPKPLPTESIVELGTRYLGNRAIPWQQDGELYWEAVLHRDDAKGERTVMMRMEPGARFPMHAHDGEREQIYVLSGSFWDDRRTFKAGDYACREPGDPHSSGTDEGCVALLIYSPG